MFNVNVTMTIITLLFLFFCLLFVCFLNDHVFVKIEREYVTGIQQTLLCGIKLGALKLTHKLSKEESVAVKNRSVTQTQCLRDSGFLRKISRSLSNC